MGLGQCERCFYNEKPIFRFLNWLGVATKFRHSRQCNFADNPSPKNQNPKKRIVRLISTSPKGGGRRGILVNSQK